MNLPKKLQKAVGNYSWKPLWEHLTHINREDRVSQIELILNVILRDGYLVLRRPDVEKQARRDSFIKSLQDYANANGAAHLVLACADRIAAAGVTESVYHEIILSLRNSVLSRFSPEQFVWGVLRQCENHKRELEAAMRASYSSSRVIDLVGGTIPVPFTERHVNPDDLSDSLLRCLTATLKMLAYDPKWFTSSGTIEFPSPNLSMNIPGFACDVNQFLADAWSQVERSDGRCRYFNGTVEEFYESTLDSPKRVVQFKFNDDGEIGLHVAGHRLKIMSFGFSRDLNKEELFRSKISFAEPTPLLPEAFVSLQEAQGALSLSQMMYTWVGDISKEFAGLKLVEWLRGYAVLQKLGAAHLSGTPKGTHGLYTLRFLEEALARGGLALARASLFIRLTLFGKNSADVFDAPLLQCQGGFIYLVDSAVSDSNLALVIKSRLASLKCDLSWKGKPLEEDTIKLFTSNGISASKIDRTVENSKCEVDCVALWGEYLFVIECKNHSLPGDNPQSEHWFMAAQESAARQARTKAATLSRNPGIVGEKLGIAPRWRKVVPIVLNGVPYSLPGPVDGVYFYDASALHRFFENGQIAVLAGDVAIEGSVVKLWIGDSPTPEDLLRQLAAPAQVMLVENQFVSREIEFQIHPNLSIRTSMIDRRPVSTNLQLET